MEQIDADDIRFALQTDIQPNVTTIANNINAAFASASAVYSS